LVRIVDDDSQRECAETIIQTARGDNRSLAAPERGRNNRKLIQGLQSKEHAACVKKLQQRAKRKEPAAASPKNILPVLQEAFSPPVHPAPTQDGITASRHNTARGVFAGGFNLH
jgi:hypothetical protein